MLANPQLKHVYLSEVAGVEFASAVWKKFRVKELSLAEAELVLKLFLNDFDIYQFIPIEALILKTAKNLITKYRVEGLRTLDSIQLATCVALKAEVDLFLTSDKLLKSLLQKEELPTEIA